MKRSGGKFTSSHTTFIESAEGLVDFAESSPLCSKITLGLITPISGSRGGKGKHIKCMQELACLFVKIRGNRAIQEIRLFSNNVVALEKAVREYAESAKITVS